VLKSVKSIEQDSRVKFLLLVVFITLISAAPRLHQIGWQIISDDEWHAVKIVNEYSYGYIFTHFEYADNCIPMSLIYELFQNTIGLNEITLRVLQIIAGLLMVPVFVYIARKYIGQWSALFLGVLLAASPFLIYYSRYARPYIFVVFLSFLALMSFYEWMRSGGKRNIYSYVACGVLAVYFNQASFPLIASPLAYGLIVLFLKCKSPDRCQFNHSLRGILGAGAGLVVGIMAWFLPAMGSVGAMGSKVGRGEVDLSTLVGFLRILNGFGSMPIVVALMVLAIAGSFWLIRDNKELGCYLLTIITVQVVSVIIVGPMAIDEAVVFMRYNIGIMPFYFILVAIGIVGFVRSVPGFPGGLKISEGAGTVACIVLYLVVNILFSPNMNVYASVNSFTSHNDYQSDYTSFACNEKTKKELVSPFYQELAKEASGTKIIEFPYLVPWDGNFYHYYQGIHGKKVYIGYHEPYYTVPPYAGDHYVKLKNYVNIASDDEVRRTSAKYLVIHKFFTTEAFQLRSLLAADSQYDMIVRKTLISFDNEYGVYARDLISHAAGDSLMRFGRPIYEDGWIVVFGLSRITDDR